MDNRNGSGFEPEKPDNVIDLSASRIRLKNKPPEKLHQAPMINLPPMTKAMLLAIIAAHVLLQLLFSEAGRFEIFMDFGFVPAHYTGVLPFTWTALLAPFTYILIHGGWVHVIMNGVMLMAFGTGAERWMGPRRLLVFCLACGVFAAAAHLALNPFSKDPVVGASGALSGLFAAVMVMMTKARDRAGLGRNRMIPFILVWIAITVALGMMGAPGGGTVAWAAHVGGFLGGFVMLRVLRLA